MNDLEDRFTKLEEKVERIYLSTEKTRKYILSILVITVIAFVLPLLLMVIAIPKFLSTYSDLSNLGL